MPSSELSSRASSSLAPSRFLSLKSEKVSSTPFKMASAVAGSFTVRLTRLVSGSTTGVSSSPSFLLATHETIWLARRSARLVSAVFMSTCITR